MSTEIVGGVPVVNGKEVSFANWANQVYWPKTTKTVVDVVATKEEVAGAVLEIPNRIGDVIKATDDLEVETNGKYLYCDGRSITRAAYPALWEIIANKYALIVPRLIRQVDVAVSGEIKYYGPITDRTHIILVVDVGKLVLVDITDGSCRELYTKSGGWTYIGRYGSCVNSYGELILRYSTNSAGNYRILIVNTQTGSEVFSMTVDQSPNSAITPLGSNKATASNTILCCRDFGDYMSDYRVSIYSVSRTAITHIWSSPVQKTGRRNYSVQPNAVVMGEGYELKSYAITSAATQSVIGTLSADDGNIISVGQQGDGNTLVATEKFKLMLFSSSGARRNLSLRELERLLGPCTALLFKESEDPKFSQVNKHGYFELTYNSANVLCTLSDGDDKVHIVNAGKSDMDYIAPDGRILSFASSADAKMSLTYGRDDNTAHQIPTQADIPYRTFIKALPGVK